MPQAHGVTTASGPAGPEAVALEEGTSLAPSATPAMGTMVDGVGCSAGEQVVYHVHTHLSVYVGGRLRPIPAGIGIVDPRAEPTAEGPFVEASHRYYWLHVHTQDGIIHIESPSVRTYTLGQFFDIWGSRSDPTVSARCRVGSRCSSTGAATAGTRGASPWGHTRRSRSTWERPSWRRAVSTGRAQGCERGCAPRHPER